MCKGGRRGWRERCTGKGDVGVGCQGQLKLVTQRVARQEGDTSRLLNRGPERLGSQAGHPLPSLRQHARACPTAPLHPSSYSMHTLNATWHIPSFSPLPTPSSLPSFPLPPQVLTLLTDAVCPHLYQYITDKFATHAARRLLCLLAGRNVLPPPSKQQQQQQQQLPGLERQPRNKGGAGGAQPLSGLAAKLGPAGGGGGGGGRGGAAALAAELLGEGEGEACRFPVLVSRLVGVVCGDDYAGEAMGELVCHGYACPFLQGLLRAAAADK